MRLSLHGAVSLREFHYDYCNIHSTMNNAISSAVSVNILGNATVAGISGV